MDKNYAKHFAKKAMEYDNKKKGYTNVAIYIHQNIIKNLELYNCEWNGNYNVVKVNVNNLTITNEYIDEYDGYCYVISEVFVILKNFLHEIGFEIDESRFTFRNTLLGNPGARNNNIYNTNIVLGVLDTI